MKQKLMFDAVLAAVDGILELPQNPSRVGTIWQELDPMLDQLSSAAKIDATHYKRLYELLSPLKAAASVFVQSVVNAKVGGSMRDDWMRFAERDLVRLKDELLALREFMVEEADFLRFACLRVQLEGLGRTNPEKLFEELHEAGAISERTWVLLMTHPASWSKALKDRELSRQLARISGWLLDLQEARKEVTVDAVEKR